MKIRSGFVSNSSSSSFIIGTKSKAKSPKIKIEIEVDVKSLNCEKFNSLSDMIAGHWFFGSYKYDLEDNPDLTIDEYMKTAGKYTKERYEKIKKIFNSGMVIYTGDVDSCSYDPIEQFLYNLKEDIETKNSMILKDY